jgi:signal transduction histidine kinase
LTLSVESMTPTAEAKGVTLTLAMQAEPAFVWADQDRLQQVFWNLLTNALKFTSTGGRVDVDMRQDSAEVRIRIRDTGSGIAPAFLPHVFERFRQGDGSSTREHGGLGLGLSIARHLVELHGGRMAADSAGEGQGSTFTVYLPAHEAQSHARRRATSVSRRPKARARDLDASGGTIGKVH